VSLESVFAAISGAVLLSERLTGSAILGGVLILLGSSWSKADRRCKISVCRSFGFG
jgi:drug/metabolite transporter (DMT)-like permease